jgi:hypothetical protein
LDKIFYLFLQRVFKNNGTNINKIMDKTKKMSKKNIPMDWRTRSEIERDRKHDAICKDFVQLQTEHPNVSVYRLFGVIADRQGMTQMGVMRVLQRRKLYTVHRSR